MNYSIFNKKNESIINDNNLNKNLKDDLGFDSLDIMELAMHFEKKYNVTLSNEDIVNCTTLNDLLKLCKQK